MGLIVLQTKLSRRARAVDRLAFGRLLIHSVKFRDPPYLKTSGRAPRGSAPSLPCAIFRSGPIKLVKASLYGWSRAKGLFSSTSSSLAHSVIEAFGCRFAKGSTLNINPLMFASRPLCGIVINDIYTLRPIQHNSIWWANVYLFFLHIWTQVHG